MMPDPLASAKELKRLRTEQLAELEKSFRAGASGAELTQRLTQQTDELIGQAYRQAVRAVTGNASSPVTSLTLAALGGYGRRQLCPYSDVDLMFLARPGSRDDSERIIKETFHQLWDMGLEIGHAVRTPKDALALAQNDVTALTSMLEARYLAGDRTLFSTFVEALNQFVLKKGKASFFQDKIEERAARLKKFGDTVCLQEPHLKEGVGALRDLHHGLWIAQVLAGVRELEGLIDSRVVSPSEAAILKQAIDHHHRLRFGLHFLCGKREDHLAFARQEGLAKSMGFEDREGELAEAAMLRHYYGHALSLKRFADSMTRIAQEHLAKRPLFSLSRKAPQLKIEGLNPLFAVRHGEIDFLQYQPHPEQMRSFFAEQPRRILDLVEHVHRYPVQWARPVCLAMEASRDLIGPEFIQDSENASRLRGLFRQPEGLARTLFELRDTGLLPRFFPELEKVQFLVRHDFYHRYTVDEHSIRAIALLERIASLKPREDLADRFSEECLAALWQNIQCPEALVLAVLFHDAGKGQGKDHSARGSELIGQVMRRLGFPPEQIEAGKFLVQKHLLLSENALRRDIDDFNTLKEVAQQAGSLERLEQLLILTYIDIAAVAPGMMTPWKAGLLWQLYLRTRRIALGEPGVQDVQERRMQILQLLQSHYNPDSILELLDMMPVQYTLFSTPGLVGRHLSALSRYDGKSARISMRFLALHEMDEDRDGAVREDTLEVILCTRDRLGLFRDIARGFNLENFHIISARLFTRKDGTVVDTIVAVNALPDSPIGPERQAILKDRLERTVGPEAKPSAVAIRPLPKRPELSSADLGRASFATRIKFDNNASADYSLIEVLAMDHPALLETLAACLTEKGLDIRFARLQRQGTRVVDAFFVTDREGRKLTDSTQRADIESFILRYLDPIILSGKEVKI